MFGFIQRRKREALLTATASGDVAGVQRSLKAGAHPDCVDENDWPCLVKAVSTGNIDIATALLDAHALVDVRCPAMLDERQRSIYEELRRRGLQAAMPGESWSPLLEAVSRGQLGMARLLLERGANPNAKHPAKLDPELYVQDGLSRNLGSQVGVNPQHKDGWTALMEAAEKGHGTIVEALLERKADFRSTTKDGTTALMCAAIGGHTACVKVLLEKGAPVDETNSDGWTALFCASARGHLSVMKLLLVGRADVNKKNRSNATALMWAVQAGPEAVEVLLAAGAQVNPVSNKGGSALMAAVMSRLPAVVRILLAAGADASIRDKNGTPLIELARATFDPEIIEMISLAVR